MAIPMPRRSIIASLLLIATSRGVGAHVMDPAPDGTPSVRREGSAVSARPLVLLHGLGRSPRSMWRLSREARRRGWQVHNLGYPSRRESIRAHAERVGKQLAAIAAEQGPLDVVTHSMGGIVLRVAVADGWIAPGQLHRVVMLAPPNGGSELADALSRTWWFPLVMGPAAVELRTAADGVPAALPPVSFPLGVIIGRRSRNPLFGRVFTGPNDGKVSVARAGVSGMHELRIVDRGHTFVMDAPEVVADVFHFLEHGRFTPTEAPAQAK